MARNITYREALNEALAQEMERDETVIVMGEDNASGAGAPGDDDAWGGVLGVTKGLYHKFPPVPDQPVLAPWQHAGYQLILSVPIFPNPPAIKSYSGPPEPGHKSYQLADYPDAVAALRQGA